MRYSIISRSTDDAFDIDQIKSQIHMKYGITVEDDFLTRSRNAVVEHIEEYLNRKLTQQTVKYYLDDFPCENHIELPFPPIVNIPSSGVVYKNSTNYSAQLSSTKWTQDIISEPGRVVLNYNDDWPTDTLATNNPISIEYRCGYGSSDIGSLGSTNIKLPTVIVQAAVMIAAAWYENREEYTLGTFGNEFRTVPLGAKHLLNSLRMKTF